MSRLLCFGDSFTFGHGLPDALDKEVEDGNPFVHCVPSKYSWPAWLGKRLESEQIINAGSLGASNKEIWNTMLNTAFLPTDVVVVMWSHHNRTCQIKHWPEPLTLDKFIWEPRQSGEYWNNKIKAYGTWMDDDAPVMDYYRDHWNDYDSELQTLLYMNHIELFVKPRVKCLVHAIIPNSQLELHQHNPVEWDTVGLDNMYDTSIVHSHFPQTPCGHMGKRACAQVAADLAEIILDKA
jgi:hypothetical protein